MDLGVSSYQLDNKERGFSYIQDESKLDMRMDQTQELTASEIVNSYPEEELYRIIKEYGEERFASRIARNICIYRKQKKIENTGELVDVIKKSIPAKFSNDGHPAKRTFQAIRIAVNNEIEPLYKTVTETINCLKPKGRLCIITFHSLEDRAVKNAFIKASRTLHLPKRFTILRMWSSRIRKDYNQKAYNSN